MLRRDTSRHSDERWAVVTENEGYHTRWARMLRIETSSHADECWVEDTEFECADLLQTGTSGRSGHDSMPRMSRNGLAASNCHKSRMSEKAAQGGLCSCVARSPRMSAKGQMTVGSQELLQASTMRML